MTMQDIVHRQLREMLDDMREQAGEGGALIGEAIRPALMSAMVPITEEMGVDFLGWEPSLAYWQRAERAGIWSRSLRGRIWWLRYSLGFGRRLRHIWTAILDRDCCPGEGYR